MTKIHVDDLISCHVIGCSNLATNWFVAKLYPIKYAHYEIRKSFIMSEKKVRKTRKLKLKLRFFDLE